MTPLCMYMELINLYIYRNFRIFVFIYLFNILVLNKNLQLLGTTLYDMPRTCASLPGAGGRQDSKHWKIPQCRQTMWSVFVYIWVIIFRELCTFA